MVDMLLQVYITTARELNVHTVTEQTGILLVLMNYKCCYLTCTKLHLHCRQPVDISLTTYLLGDFGLLYL